MEAVDMVIWLVPIGIAAIAWFIYARSEGRSAANFRAAVHRLGLKTAAAVGSETQAASGEVQGRQLRFSQVVERHGGAQPTDWVEIHLETPAAWAFCVRHKHAGRAMLQEFQASHIAIGDPDFDARWDAAADNPGAFKQMLTPEVRLLMDVVTASSLNAEFRLDNGLLTYREQTNLDGPTILARLDGLLKMMLKLADAAEAAVK